VLGLFPASVYRRGLEAVVCAGTVGISAGAGAQEPAAVEYFEERVRPLLADHCVACHNPAILEGGLDLTSAAGFLSGSTTGALVDLDEPDASRLLRAVSYEEPIKMPPSGRLSAEEIASLELWVRAGAPWPGSSATASRTTSAEARSEGFTDEERDHWAFQPLSDASPPDAGVGWARNDIDRFIAAKLDESGLTPAPAADRLSLLRRVTYDLTGLAPTEDEVLAFVADDTADAYEQVVERLLASKHYGERWGRHWLDVARYADSTGNDEDHRYPYAWRYRDYVISAFNEDLPYDQFVREQIAGDLLPSTDPTDAPGVNRRGIVATGFLAVGPKALAQQDKKKMLYDVYDEQLDVVSKAFLGLTVTCARCHDHKFDPIPTRDYYSMVGIFASTQSFADSTTHVAKLLYRPLGSDEEYERYRLHRNRVLHKRADADRISDLEVERLNASRVPEMSSYMAAARRVYEGGEDAIDVARSGGLELGLLEKWVDYLRPRTILRPHMTRWHEARPDEVEEVAAGYQDRDQARVAEWDEKIAARWKAIEVLRPEMDEPPPRRPEVLEGTDRFFYDVHFAKGGPLAVAASERERFFREEALESLRRVDEELVALSGSAPPTPDMACSVAEGERVAQKVFLRGDYRNEGPPAPAGFLSILTEGDGSLSDSAGSGRLPLAQWVTQPDNPLTARVMVNRVWQWHFGQGLVRTASNFGKMGEPPSHPELLDYLAKRFIDSGWSVKQLHRLILDSQTYGSASAISRASFEKDPENRLLSHFNRRRLDVEEIRDGLLAISGVLDDTMGGTLDEGTGTDLENSDDRLSLDPAAVRRRMIYLPLRRANLPTLLGLFDFGDAVNSVAQRARTNVAPQALFMMNSEFVAERSTELASRLLARSAGQSDRLHAAHLAILNRPPRADELEEGSSYIERFQRRFRGPYAERQAWASWSRVLIASNSFIYVD